VVQLQLSTFCLARANLRLILGLHRTNLSQKASLLAFISPCLFLSPDGTREVCKNAPEFK